jgi:pSer/pThr/pTyr-binding forkhead associated (FHA) protein
LDPKNYSYKIGRAEGDLIISGDQEISKEHCEVTFMEDLFLIKDLKSTNGVEVNGVKIPINSFYQVKDNDKIKIGKTELTLIKQSDGPKEGANTPKPPSQTNHIPSGEPKCNPILKVKVDDAKVHANNVIEILDSDDEEMPANPPPSKPTSTMWAIKQDKTGK